MQRYFTTLVAVCGLTAMVGLSSATVAMAQNGTPAASPEASQCTIEPRPVDFLVPIVEAPDPETTPTLIAVIPTGSEVDPATRDAVLTVVYTLTACVNAGDYLRAFALYDDAYLRRIIDPEGFMDADIAIELGKQFAAVNPSDEDDFTRIVRVVSIAAQTDGNVAVAVETSGGVERDQDDSQIDLFVLRQTESGWLIVDGASNLPPEDDPGTPPAA